MVLCGYGQGLPNFIEFKNTPSFAFTNSTQQIAHSRPTVVDILNFQCSYRPKPFFYWKLAFITEYHEWNTQ